MSKKPTPERVARDYVIAAKSAVAELMDRHDLTQSDVARITGRSQAAVSRWLDPETHQFFDLHHYALLCIYLKAPPAVILPPADWTPGSYQAVLKQLIKLPERDLVFLLEVHQLASAAYGKK